MTTQCNATKLTFHELDSREVVGRFDGGEITSDAGGVLLREVEKHPYQRPAHELVDRLPVGSREIHRLAALDEGAHLVQRPDPFGL